MAKRLANRRRAKESEAVEISEKEQSKPRADLQSEAKGAAAKSHLLIVESPAKAKTIKKFLGRGFMIKASLGHVRDIPNRVKGRGKERFGIDFENGYQPIYAPIPERQKVLKELNAAAAKADL
ncbi:MAG: toprim domain-containing protein, partial [Planctomycetota bacterium]|nr:toprim domain-containing protein [Planctomycetota bacterium]